MCNFGQKKEGVLRATVSMRVFVYMSRNILRVYIMHVYQSKVMHLEMCVCVCVSVCMYGYKYLSGRERVCVCVYAGACACICMQICLHVGCCTWKVRKLGLR